MNVSHPKVLVVLCTTVEQSSHNSYIGLLKHTFPHQKSNLGTISFDNKVSLK